MTIDNRLSIALQRIFVPLARILIRAGVQSRPVLDLLRWAFVQAAIEELGDKDHSPSTSKIAQSTGLARKTVSELRLKTPSDNDLDSIYRVELGDLITLWTASSDFVDDLGNPRPLEVKVGEATFADLVNRHHPDADYESVLDRLVQAGNVVISSDGKAQLVKRAWITATDAPMLLTDTVAAGLSSAERILRDKEHCGRVIHRTIYTSNIDPSKIKLAHRSIRQRTEQFSRDLDDFLAANKAPIKQPLFNAQGNELHRLGVTVYYFELEK